MNGRRRSGQADRQVVLNARARTFNVWKRSEEEDAAGEEAVPKVGLEVPAEKGAIAGVKQRRKQRLLKQRDLADKDGEDGEGRTFLLREVVRNSLIGLGSDAHKAVPVLFV